MDDTPTQKKDGALNVLGLVFGLAVFGFIVWGFMLSGEDTSSPCVSGTRTVKNIKTVDGKMVGYEEEEVEGCTTSDGYFVPRPDY